MEYVEGIVNFLKRHIKPQENLADPVGWNYETYREYLLAISKSRDYLLPIEEYPSKIEFSHVWHETFNQIRSSPNEKWVLIGYQEGQRRLVLPTAPEEGFKGVVPYEVMVAGINKARLKAGISDLVGDLHSHPRDFVHPGWVAPGYAAFSVGDMYYLLQHLKGQRPADPKRSSMFVTEGNENIAAFASRRSLEKVRNSFSGSYEEFANNWYSRFGWSFKGFDPTKGELAEPTNDANADTSDINKAIAHHYQLALYRGVKDKPLLRDYPAII